ncbi:MAG: lysophospholipid acyltransferase family protein [Proteobacteria bacterium]|nr:lysophospholipid acyltransferase family protein [Pseudomonadota bacterium]
MLKSLWYRLIAVIYISFIFLTSSVFFVIALVIWLVTFPFDRRLSALHLFTCFWASLYIWVFPPWRVSVEGRENIDPDETYVIVSNHQSLVDILVAFTLFIHFKWVSKAELFRIPLIGWNMSLNRYVKLRRGNSRSIKTMYQACENHLSAGSSVYLFPEGTRSETGQMRQFKEGAFVLAKRLDRPVLPLVINGSRTAVPKNSLNFHGETHVRVSILPPLQPDTFRDLTARELADRVQQTIEANLDREPPEPGNSESPT